jgi:hypothetical protein
VHREVNSKVVDLTTLYNVYKGSIVLFSTYSAQIAAKLVMSLCFGKQKLLAVDQVFTFFLSKFEMPIYMKVVSIDKLDNFHIGRF